MKKSDEKLISRGMDGALHPDERERLERLREQDPSVRETERVWTLLGDRLRSMPVNPPDATVAWQDIRRTIRQQESDPAAETDVSAGRLRWAGVFASFILAAVLGFYAWQMLRSPVPALGSYDEPSANRVEWVIAEIPGATTMIYTDTETDLTVIWMDVAQSVDPRDT